MNSNKTFIAVIGGGASGLCAAITAAREIKKQGLSKKVIILERADRFGRKILASGNGRCNLMNESLPYDRFHGDKHIIEGVFSQYNTTEITDFFKSIGVLLQADESGRVYPYSNRAETVLSSLLAAVKALDIEIITSFDIKEIIPSKNNILIVGNNEEISAQRVIFACGSSAQKGLGNDSGYSLVKKLGFKLSPVFPSLCSVAVEGRHNILKGVRAKGKVTVFCDGKMIKSESGEIQFTDTSLSGICVFNISRIVNQFCLFKTVNEKKYGNMNIEVNLMPNFSFDEITSALFDRKKALSDCTTQELLSGILDKKLAEFISKRIGKFDNQVKNSEIKHIANELCHLSFVPVLHDNTNGAQVMAGGVSGDDIDCRTLCAKRDKRIFFCGEILDVDGDCGGYNLSFAWASGMLSGKSAVTAEVK